MLDTLRTAIGHNLDRVITESKDTITSPAEVGRSSLVILLLGWVLVIGSVNLNNQPARETDKIHNIGRHGVLGDNGPFPQVAI
jgi:hypothetical protein